MAAGLNDSRCEMLHLDAFSWVAVSAACPKWKNSCTSYASQSTITHQVEEQHSKGTSAFDLVVIDFTDEPVKGCPCIMAVLTHEASKWP